MSRPARARIRNSFERAAPTYDAAAVVQRRVCARLAAGLPAAITARRILDAGCGTGFALPLLHRRYPAARSIALDFAPAMLRHIGEPCWLLAGDLEHLPLGPASIDLYWSSLAVQWCDLARALAEARRVLADGGALAIASLGPRSVDFMKRAVVSHQGAGERLNLSDLDPDSPPHRLLETKDLRGPERDDHDLGIPRQRKRDAFLQAGRAQHVPIVFSLLHDLAWSQAMAELLTACEAFLASHYAPVQQVGGSFNTSS